MPRGRKRGDPDWPLRRELGEAIRQRRLALGLTQRDVSQRTGGVIRDASICQYERGDVMPLITSYVLLCRALEVGLLDLLPGSMQKMIQT
jgi:transcriptional regulator with XRE-family HTH domain